MAEIDERHLSDLFDKVLTVRADFTELQESFDTWVRMGDGFASVFANDISEGGMDDAVAAEYGTAIAGVVASMLGSVGGKEVEALALMEMCVRAGLALGAYGTVTRKFSRETVARMAQEHAEANRRGIELDDMLSNLE